MIHNGAPHLPVSDQFSVSFKGHSKTSYTTGELGERISISYKECKGRNLLVFGDSQVLGYGVAFEQTFPCQVGTFLGINSECVSILASPAMDPENSAELFKQFILTNFQSNSEIIYAVNLENDLDEMFFRGQIEYDFHRSELQNYLIRNSFIYTNWLIIKQNFISPSRNPLGINAITYGLLPDERVVLTEYVAEKIDDNLEVLPKNRVTIVLIPTVLQLDKNLFSRFKTSYEEKEFVQMVPRSIAAAEMMNTIDGYLTSLLQEKNYKVISLKQILQGNPAIHFNEFTNHLTIEGHERIADTLAKTLK